MAMHEGHRDRLKSRFRKEGLGGFEELYVLELLLFYCIPRRDTNPIAHNLLDKFGTLNRVLSASPEELKSVEGVSDSVVTYFQFLLQLERYRQVRKDEENIKIITCQNNAFARLGGVFINQRNENVFVMCLDSKGKILGVFQVNEGNVSSSSINARRIIEICLNANATYVILAHNHPGGFAVASYQDSLPIQWRPWNCFCWTILFLRTEMPLPWLPLACINPHITPRFMIIIEYKGLFAFPVYTR